jgi:hypothetical protein
LQTSAKKVELAKHALDLAIESVVAEDAKELADEWLANLADLRERFWLFDGLTGRKSRNHPETPKQYGDSGYRPMKLDTSIHEIVIRSRGVIGGDDAIHEKQAKAVAVGEYIMALRKDADAKL